MEIGGAILEVLYAWGRMIPRPLEGPYVWANRIKNIDSDQYRRSVKYLKKRGLVKIISKNDKRFIQLTQAGQLEVLLNKAKIQPEKKWRGKWWLVIFDIPESSKEKRHLFRTLLKSNGFYKLQASVYVSPCNLNREAVIYLKQTGLVSYIRIMRVDYLDNDIALKKHFNLK